MLVETGLDVVEMRLDGITVDAMVELGLELVIDLTEIEVVDVAIVLVEVAVVSLFELDGVVEIEVVDIAIFLVEVAVVSLFELDVVVNGRVDVVRKEVLMTKRYRNQN